MIDQGILILYCKVSIFGNSDKVKSFTQLSHLKKIDCA